MNQYCKLTDSTLWSAKTLQKIHFEIPSGLSSASPTRDSWDSVTAHLHTKFHGIWRAQDRAELFGRYILNSKHLYNWSCLASRRLGGINKPFISQTVKEKSIGVLGINPPQSDSQIDLLYTKLHCHQQMVLEQILCARGQPKCIRAQCTHELQIFVAGHLNSIRGVNW